MQKRNNPAANDKSGNDERRPGATGRTHRFSLAALRQILIDLRDQEAIRVRQLGRGWAENKDPLPKDEGDQARAQQDVEMFASLVNFSDNRLATIEAALQRLEQGRYGICEGCGDQIAFERLRVLPTTVYCLDCQDQREITARTTSTRDSGFPLRDLRTFEDDEEDERRAPSYRRESLYPGPDSSPVKLALVRKDGVPVLHTSRRRDRHEGARASAKRRH